MKNQKIMKLKKIAFLAIFFGLNLNVNYLNATTYTVTQNSTSISVFSGDVGFSQQSTNTFYFPDGLLGTTTFSFSNGTGFYITGMNEAPPTFNRSSFSNIIGIPTVTSSGFLINAILGYGYLSNYSVYDKNSNALLFTGNFLSNSGRSGFAWFSPAFTFSYLNGQLIVNAIGPRNNSGSSVTINADGTFSISNTTIDSSQIGIFNLFGAVIGPTAFDTIASLALSANRLKSIYNLQSSALINGLSYDCQVFDKNNICLSTGGRYSVNSGAYGNTTSALLIGAYRLNKNVRIGAWVDQNLSANTVTGINLGNSKPLFGVFGAWAENPTGEGYEVKVSAGYGDKDLTVTRDVIGTSEAGVGNSRLNSQAISSVSSYGFRLNNQLLASPYVGIRYSKITSNGYTEASSDAVTAPLTYNRLSQENVALMAGLKLSAKLDPKTTLVASAGIEQNLKNRSGQYSATGVDGLTPIEFNSNVQKTRATASVGAYYDIDKKQRVAVNGIYREETFHPTATTSVLATYTVGF